MYKLTKLLTLSLVALTLVACGTDNYSANTVTDSMANKTEEMGVSREAVMMADNSMLMPEVYDDGAQVSDQHLIKTGNISYETVDYEADKDKLISELDNYKAQVNRLEEYTNDQQYIPYNYTEPRWDEVPEVKTLHTLSITAQVPNDKFDEVAAKLQTIAKVTHTSIGTENVTDRVVDLERRIESINAKIERLEVLYEQANSMEDIITIQTELENAFSEKERLEGEHKQVEQQVAYSTFYLTLNEVEELKDKTERRRTFGDYVAEATRNSGIAFVRSMEDLVIGLIYVLPYILVFGAFILILKKVVRRRNDKIGTGNKTDKES